MDAAEIVKRLGAGVRAALKTNELFLGIERGAFENADIHPEYVTTVKVAEQLTEPEYVVSLETRMMELRRHARDMAQMRAFAQKPPMQRTPGGASGAIIDARLAKYGFGKKRLDILVRRDDPSAPPVLFAEAKLGAKNVSGILEDVNRVVRLMAMYQEFELLTGRSVYGAVVFHVMAEGDKATTLHQDTLGVLGQIQSHLMSLSMAHSWMKQKAGLLSSAQVSEPIQGYEEIQLDGSSEMVFGKEQFAFAPCLALMGTASDIPTVAL